MTIKISDFMFENFNNKNYKILILDKRHKFIGSISKNMEGWGLDFHLVKNGISYGCGEVSLNLAKRFFIRALNDGYLIENFKQPLKTPKIAG